MLVAALDYEEFDGCRSVRCKHSFTLFRDGLVTHRLRIQPLMILTVATLPAYVSRRVDCHSAQLQVSQSSTMTVRRVHLFSEGYGTKPKPVKFTLLFVDLAMTCRNKTNMYKGFTLYKTQPSCPNQLTF